MAEGVGPVAIDGVQLMYHLLAERPRFVLSCTAGAQPQMKNVYIHNVKREDYCREDRITNQKFLLNFFPDQVDNNELWVREEYELSMTGWYPPALFVEYLFGTPTIPMVLNMKQCYSWVRTIQFEQFSSVYATLKLVSVLESCEEIKVLLDDGTVSQSRIDEECDAYGCPYLNQVESLTVRHMSICRSPVAFSKGHWFGRRSRVNCYVKWAHIVFPNLVHVKIDVFGNDENFRCIDNFMSKFETKPQFVPHKLIFNDYTIQAEYDSDRFHPSVQCPQPPAKVVAPAPHYMRSDLAFMNMRYHVPLVPKPLPSDLRLLPASDDDDDDDDE